MVFGITRFNVLPIFFLPIFFVVGAQSFYWTITSFVALIGLLLYIRFGIPSRSSQSKFFLSWAIFSVIYLWALFIWTIWSINILPREHYILVALTFVSVFFFRLVKRRAKRKTSVTEGDELQGITCYTRHATCTKCHRPFISSGPLVCSECKPASGRWKHHCIWLNCYITERNHLLFLIGHAFAAVAFIFGANMSLTSICRPIFVFETFETNLQLPENCSNVYENFELALGLMGSIYAAGLSFYCIFVIIRQFFFKILDLCSFGCKKVALF